MVKENISLDHIWHDTEVFPGLPEALGLVKRSLWVKLTTVMV